MPTRQTRRIRKSKLSNDEKQIVETTQKIQEIENKIKRIEMFLTAVFTKQNGPDESSTTNVDTNVDANIDINTDANIDTNANGTTSNYLIPHDTTDLPSPKLTSRTTLAPP